MRSVADIIKLWPGITSFGDEVGCGPTTANHWRRRNSIPAEWFASVARAAERRQLEGLTADDLAAMAEHRRLAKASADLQPAA